MLKEGLLHKTYLLIPAILTLLVYLPTLHNGFVNWDDNAYVYENLNIRSIDYEFIKWAFSFEANPTWHPLALFSHALDFAVWRLNSSGHHLTSILFHAFNTWLVFVLVIQLFHTRDPHKRVAFIPAVVTSILFGIHPLHVESVAWVSERKDVLYAFFYLLSLTAYLKYVSSVATTAGAYYFACLCLFILSLMSKPMAVSLPAVMLILDLYPIERLNERRMKSLKYVLMEKLPFFALSILSSLAAILSQHRGGTLQSLDTVPFVNRLLVAAKSFILYLCKIVMPFNLSPFYPYPNKIDLLSPEYIGSVAIILLITCFCVRLYGRHKLFMAVWLFYVVTMIPVIGIIQVGSHAMADRYTYLASLGPFLLIGAGTAYLFEKFPKKQMQVVIVFILTVASIFMLITTVKQIGIWKNSITLWSHNIRIYPDVEFAYNNRGMAYKILGNYQEAIKNYNMAIAINPIYANAYYNRGNAYMKTRDTFQAIRDYNMAIELDPNRSNSYFNRGNVYDDLGNYDQAIRDYNTTIRLDPTNAMAYYNLGLAYSKVGNIDKAKAYFTKASSLGLGAFR